MLSRTLFNPKRIAVIGATNNKEKVGGILMNKLQVFNGKVIPINPNEEDVFDLRTYSSVLSCSKKIDLAIIAVPAKIVPKVLEQCGKKKIKYVIVISAGFSETGNKRLEEKIVTIAKSYNIGLLGPNCFGIENPYLNLDATFSKDRAKKGNIAFLSQSGALWSYLNDFSLKQGLGFSNFASLGNMSDISFNDLIFYLNKDKKTKHIILYIEKLKDGKKFIEACKKSKKKIYAIKAGSTEKGSEAAVSHTGSLATDFEIYEGAFKQAGVIQCNSLVEALEKIKDKKFTKKPKKIKLNKNIKIITNAGGAGALTVDYLTKNNYNVKNINDILGTATPEDYKKNIQKYFRNKKIKETLIVILTSQYMSDENKTAEVISELGKKQKKNLIVLFLGGKNMMKANKIFRKNNIRYFNTLEGFRKSL